MKDASPEYLAVLSALGEHIEANKNSLVFARYEIENLQRKLDEAQQEIAELKEK